MPQVVVQKFGGTSLATAELREIAAARVQACHSSGSLPVVVVSAIGRNGSPYATDTLLALANDSADLGGRSHDLIASCGEIISAVVFSQVLKSLGIDAVPLTGAQAGIVTNGVFRTARVTAIDCNKIRTHVEAGQIPVVAGYQGLTHAGDITTLGRGGSDTTACMLGAALRAARVEIYTDVDGLMTADPRLVPEARLITEAEYSEVRALALKGANVIHPEALEFAHGAGVPLHIRSTDSSVPGTIVHFGSETSPVTGIASFSDVDFFSLSSAQQQPYASGLGVFSDIADANISVHFIDVRPNETTFVVETKYSTVVSEILSARGVAFQTSSDYAKVSVIGVGMTGKPGMMATVVDTLSDRNIAIFQSTDSQTSISVLVRREDEPEAVRTLHMAFGLGAE